MTSSPTSLTSSTVGRPNQLGLPNIAFVGKAGAGKSTAAALLTEFGYQTISFAAALKDCAAMLWGADARTDRSKLQPLGTEVARLIDEDVWVNLLLKKLRAKFTPTSVNGHTVWACDDCRFENEWYALKAEGFVMVRLTTPIATRMDRLKANGKWQGAEQLDHASETATDHLKADHEIANEGAPDALYDDIVDIIIKERKRR